MKHKILLSALFLLLVGGICAQQTSETKLSIVQIETLPLDHFFTSDGTQNITLARIAANIGYTPADGTFSVDDVKEALDANRSAIAALQAGGSDGVVSGGSFTGTSSKTLTLTRTVGGDVAIGPFTDEVNDADANATNEIQSLNRAVNTNLFSLSLGGGNASTSDLYDVETFVISSTTSTLSLSNIPSPTYLSSMTITRRGLPQTIATSGTAADVTVAGSTLTFNYRDLEPGDVVVVRSVRD